MDTLDLIMLENQLSHSRVKIEFIKLDGTYRVMVCTKSFNIIPTDHYPSGSQTNVNQEVFRVFDLEKQGWRSVRKDRIRQWELCT